MFTPVVVLLVVLTGPTTVDGGVPAKKTRAMPVVITSSEELAKHLGKVVTLHGTVERSKVATLLGVDVESTSPDLRGKEAWATGRLEAYETEDPSADGIMRAGRGAGKYLRLVDTQTRRLAQVSAAR